MSACEQIAKIEGVKLGWDDHGILTCYVALRFGGSSVSVGGYAFDEPRKDDQGKHIGRVGAAFGMEWIARLMRAAGVDDFAKVKGRTVLAMRESEAWAAAVIGLKPLLTDPGEPFVFADLVAEYSPAVEAVPRP